MDLVLKKEVASRIGYDHFTPFGMKREDWQSWRETYDLDLGTLSTFKLDDLEALLTRFKNVRGVGVLLHDIAVWRDVLATGAQQKRARTVRQFETLLEQYLLHVPGHRIYKRHEDGAWLAYYVTKVKYHAPQHMNGGGMSAPSVDMILAYREIGGAAVSTVTFHADDVIGVPTAEALSDKGYIIEDDTLRADYLEQYARYSEVAQKIGHQFWGRGYAYSQTDGSLWERRKSTTLDRYGEPSRVVIDVFQEDAKQKNMVNYIDLGIYYWTNIGKKAHYNPEDDTSTLADDDEDTVVERPEIEVPTHPWLVVFHLAKHQRLRVHVAQVEEYIYDDNLADKLVLPQDQKNLVKLLIETKGGMFKDIVQGKGGGAVVLLTGNPGVGKTLTAEVYAESEHRALYSVQCSQLGTDPNKLEENLMVVFDRARRWNAVLLLDEADVYVHERGNSMEQNAIVGVFLRVLEYQGSILFLTSNRPNDVDDAIASRCIARLHYKEPDAEHAERIWRVLAENSGVPMYENLIHRIVTANPGMTGRDIKNILKLAMLMRPEGERITFDQIEYVKQFKPTGAIMERVS